MGINFGKWLMLQENIVIDDGGTEAVLRVVDSNSIREFNYQTEDSWSSFLIMPQQAQRVGYVSIGTQPTHIAIVKTTPIEPNNGADIAFLKSLNSMLSSQFKAVPYKEAGTQIRS